VDDKASVSRGVFISIIALSSLTPLPTGAKVIERSVFVIYPMGNKLVWCLSMAGVLSLV